MTKWKRISWWIRRSLLIHEKPTTIEIKLRIWSSFGRRQVFLYRWQRVINYMETCWRVCQGVKMGVSVCGRKGGGANKIISWIKKSVTVLICFRCFLKSYCRLKTLPDRKDKIVLIWFFQSYKKYLYRNRRSSFNMHVYVMYITPLLLLGVAIW